MHILNKWQETCLRKTICTPYVILGQVSPLLPVFSWCGSEDTADIVLPTYDVTEATLEMMGR